MMYELKFYDTDNRELSTFTTSAKTDTLLNGVAINDVQINTLRYNKEIYNPCLIEVSLQIECGENASADNICKAFKGLRCSLTSPYENDKKIADNYYVHEATILKDSTPLILKLNIYSMDKLMDIVEECHSYVGQHLCTDIMKNGAERYVTGTDYQINTNISVNRLQFLKSSNGCELIQPYIVQYNETFYSMLARTANRCGEYMYFEDGKLNVGFVFDDNNTTVNESELALLSAELPELSANAIFNDIQMFARNYSIDNDSQSDNSGKGLENVGNIIDDVNNAKEGLNNPTDAEKEAYDNLIKTLKDLQEKKESYHQARLYVEMYENIGALITNEEKKLKDYFDVIIPEKYDFDENNHTVKQCEDAKSKAEKDYNDKRDSLSKEEGKIWNKEKEDRYEMIHAKPESQRTEEEKAEIEELTYEKFHQDDIKNNIKTLQDELSNIEKIIKKICIYKQIAEYKECQTNITDKQRTWNGNVYTTIDELDKAWKAYIETINLSDDIDKIKDKLPEDLKKELEELSEMLSDTNGYADITKTALGQGNNSFIYDYSLPMDEYLLDYTNKGYAEFCSDGNGQYVTADVLFKLINTPGGIIENVALTALYVVWILGDMALKRDAANSDMDDAMGDIHPKATEDKEYKNGDTHRLYSSFDNSETEALLKNINAAGMAIIRRYEKTLTNTRLKLKLDTANNTKQLALGKKIMYDGKEYIVTKMTGEYDTTKNSASEEMIEAVPLQVINDTAYCIPPMIPEGHVRYAEPQTAKVTGNMDPQKMGRVRITYGWQENDSVENCNEASPLIRVATPFAAKGGGMFFQLAVGEEVMINYDHGNVERPYVACSLFNSGVKPAMGNDLFSPITRVIRSQNGHKIVFNDLDGDYRRFIAGSGLLKLPLAPDIQVGPGEDSLEDRAKDSAKQGDEGESEKQYAGGVSMSDKIGFYSIEASTDQRKISLESVLGNIDMDAFTGININCPWGDLDVNGKNIYMKARNKINILSGIRYGQPFWSVNQASLQDFVSSAVKDYIFDLTLVRTILERVIEPVTGCIKEIAATHVEKPDVGYIGGETTRFDKFLVNFFSSMLTSDDEGFWNGYALKNWFNNVENANHFTWAKTNKFDGVEYYSNKDHDVPVQNTNSLNNNNDNALIENTNNLNNNNNNALIENTNNLDPEEEDVYGLGSLFE